MGTDIVSVSEAAVHLNLTPQGVRYLIRAGRLPATRVGPPRSPGLYMIERKNLDRIVRLRPGRKRKHK